MKEPIRKIEMKDGTLRYRLVVDIGRDDEANDSTHPDLRQAERSTG